MGMVSSIKGDGSDGKSQKWSLAKEALASEGEPWEDLSGLSFGPPEQGPPDVSSVLSIQTLSPPFPIIHDSLSPGEETVYEHGSHHLLSSGGFPTCEFRHQADST